jgi:adenylate cyclase
MLRRPDLHRLFCAAFLLACVGAMHAQDRSRLQACVDSCTSAFSEGSLDLALRHAEEAMGIAESLKDSSAISEVLVKQSGIRMRQGDYNSSLRELQRALRIYEGLRNEDGIATVYTSIGSIHYYDRNYEQAQEYYGKGLEIRERIGSRADAATLYGNIGSVIEEMGRPDSALAYHRRHLAIRRELGHASWIPICYTNLGVCFDKLRRSDSALYYLEASLALTTAEGQPDRASAYAMCMLGMARLNSGQFANALRTCTKSLAIAEAFNDLPMQEQSCKCLYRAHEALGDSPMALRMHKRFIAIRDSISGEERAKELMRLELTYHFDQAMLADSLKRLEEKRLADIAAEQRVSRERDQKRIFIFSSIGVLLLAGGLWSRLRYMRRSRNLIQIERDRSEGLLLNILPKPIADELKANGRAAAREVDGVSILFTDFHDFTRMSERLSAHELVAEIDACFRAFDGIAARHGLEKIKTIGDAYMCAGGLPDPRPKSARDTVLAALEMQDWLKAHGAERAGKGLPYFTMRAGIHTGSVVAGIVGDTKFQYDIWGDTVNTAAHLEAAGSVGEVNISEATFDLIQDDPGLTFSPRGRVRLKSKGEMAMFFARLSSKAARTPGSVVPD